MRRLFPIFFHEGDPLIPALAAALSRKLGSRAHVLPIESSQLAAAGWKHHLSQNGTRTLVEIPGGPILDSSVIAGGVNRLQYVSGPRLRTLADTEYGNSETLALIQSWLRSLSGRWINPVSHRGLSGPRRSWLEWSDLAARSGIETTPFNGATSRWCEPASPAADSRNEKHVVIVADYVAGSEGDMDAACRKMAAASGYVLLALRFNGANQLCAIEPHPAELSAEALEAVADWIC
jgi:hypothetical protein